MGISSNEGQSSEKINNIISNVKLLPLKKKVELALLIFSMTLDEDKATILTIWYQYKHDSVFFETLSEEFEKVEPKIFLPPLNPDHDKNYEFILKGITRTKGFIGIEGVFLNYIKSTTEEFEIDRLLYIIFAIDKAYNILADEILNLSYKNWLKWGKAPLHYELLLYKTTIDILLYKKKHSLVIEKTIKVYKALEMKDRLYWLKYQYTNVLLNLYENGYKLKEYSEEQLLEKRDSYANQADVDDYFCNIDNNI